MATDSEKKPLQAASAVVIPSDMTLISELTTIEDVKSCASEGKLFFSNVAHVKNFPLKICSIEMNKFLNVWNKTKRTSKWMCIHETLYPFHHGFDAKGFTILDVWNDTFNLPSVDCEHWFWEKLPEMCKMKLLIIRHHFVESMNKLHSNEEVSSEELSIYSFLSGKINDYNISSGVIILWNQFCDDKFKPPFDCDAYHPFLYFWQDLRISIDIRFMYNYEFLSCNDIPLTLIKPNTLPSPLLFELNKHLIENKLLGCSAKDIMNTTLPPIKFNFEELKSRFKSPLAKAMLANNLDENFDKFWSDLKNHQSLFAAADIRQSRKFPATILSMVICGTYEGSIGNLMLFANQSGTEQQQYLDQFNHTLNMVDNEMVDVMNSILSLVYGKQTNSVKEVTVTQTNLVIFHSHLMYIEGLSDTKYMVLHGLLLLANLAVHEPVSKSYKPIAHPPFSTLKQTMFSPSLASQVEDIQSNFNNPVLSKMKTFQQLLKLTGNVFEEYVEIATKLQRTEHDYPFIKLLKNLCIVTTDEDFHTSTPCPNVDFIHEKTATVVEVIYAGNAPDQKESLSTKFSRMESECRAHGFEMPKVEILASQSTSDWPEIVKRLCKKLNITFTDFVEPNQLNLLEQALKQTKRIIMSSLTHDEQERIKVSVRLAHGWDRTNKDLPSHTIDDPKFHNKLAAMCKREHEMFQLDNPGIHMANGKPNYMNLIHNATWKGAFSNEAKSFVTDWDNRFLDTYVDKMENIMVKGVTNVCMENIQIKTLDGDQILMFFCTNHNETMAQQLSRYKCKRYATMIERFTMSGMSITPSTFNRDIAIDLKAFATTANPVDDRVDYLTKIPSGIQQTQQKQLIQYLTSFSQSKHAELLETIRKDTHNESNSTSLAHLMRKAQQVLSLKSGYPVVINDASHIKTVFKTETFQKLLHALNKNDKDEFYLAIESEKPDFKMNITNYRDSKNECVLPDKWKSPKPNEDLWQLLRVDPDFDEVYANCLKQKELWNVLYHAQKEFNKMTTLTQNGKEQEQLKRKRENLHKLKYDEHFPEIKGRVQKIAELMDELEEDLNISIEQLDRFQNMIINGNLVSDAKRYMTSRGFTNVKTLELIKQVVKRLCRNRGFLYAVHCMDVAEQIDNAMSSKLGPANMTIRNCEMTGMQLVAHMNVQPTKCECDCLLFSSVDPGSCDKFGPSVSALNRLSWEPVPNTTMYVSHKFKMTDVHIEQYTALPAYILDNVITELQLQQTISTQQYMNWSDPTVDHVIKSNCGLWNIEASRVDKQEGSMFLTGRYIMMNMFGVSHFDKLSEKCSYKPKTSFDHWVLNKMVAQLNKMDHVVTDRDKFSAGTMESYNQLIKNQTLDEENFSTIESDETVCKIPLLYSEGISNSAAMMIHELFKGYQQTRHEIDVRSAKITVGNKIEEICHDVRTVRKSSLCGCDKKDYVTFGLRGYTTTLFDQQPKPIEFMTSPNIKQSLETIEPCNRSVDEESNLAIMLATNQLALPSCCAAMTSIGSKLLTADHLVSPEESLKAVNFSESETDMIKSTSRNHKPLFDLPPLNQLQDKASSIEATHILKMHPKLTREKAYELLSNHGINANGKSTKEAVETIIQTNKEFNAQSVITYWKERNGSSNTMVVDDELAILHALCRENTSMTNHTDYVSLAKTELNHHLEEVQWETFSLITPAESDSMIDIIKRYKTMLVDAQFPINKSFTISRLLKILFCCSNSHLPATTLNDIYKEWNKPISTEHNMRQQMIIDIIAMNLDVPHTAIPLLTLMASTHIPLHDQFDMLFHKTTIHLTTEVKTALHILPVATEAKAANTPLLDSLLLLSKLNLKTTLKRLRRSTGMQSFKLPTSKRMNKGLSIASRMLSSTLLNVSKRMETKFDRVLNSFYSSNKMTYGRSFKEQLEKARELPIKDEIADIKTDFVERVSQSLLLRVHADACANPKLKKKIQREMSSKLYDSLRSVRPDQSFKINTSDGEQFIESTKRAWTVIIGNLDHSAWGPNHAPAFFSWQFAPRNNVLGETIATICTMFCLEGSQKDDEIFPEMWHAWVDKKFNRELLPEHVKGLFDFFKKFNKAARPNAFDMGQGMFHITSSDYAQCTCKTRQLLLMKFARRLGIIVNVTDQQGSDDRHALWEIRPSKEKSCMTHKEFKQCVEDFKKYSKQLQSDFRFDSNIQQAFEYITIAADCMISKSMNLKLSPKSGNGKVISEMNSHFEECEREINPLVRETAPLCKFRPIGSHFESITQLIQLCRSGYACGSSELSIMTIFLHKDTRIRKAYNFSNLKTTKLLKMVSGLSHLPIYSMPVNLGGSVLPLINDVALGSTQWIEELKMESLQTSNTKFSTLLLKAESLMYKHIQTSLPDDQNESSWGIESLPRPPFVRRGIKQKYNFDMLQSLIDMNATIHQSVIEKANKDMTLLNKLDILTQSCTPTTTKLGELHRLSQMLNKLKRTQHNPNLTTRSRDTSRAIRSKSFKHLCPHLVPSKQEMLDVSGKDWDFKIDVVQSNVPECSGQMCTQDDFYMSWLLSAITLKESYEMPVYDKYSLAAEASKIRKNMSHSAETFNPSYATVEITNRYKVTQLHTSPLKILLQSGHPQLLTYKGMTFDKTANTEKDMNLLQSLCNTEIGKFKTIISELASNDLTTEILKEFEELAISVWQKTKNCMIENIELAVPKPRTDKNYSSLSAVHDIVSKSVIRGLKFEIEPMKHIFATDHLLEISDELTQKCTSMKTFLSMCCSLEMEVAEAYSSLVSMEQTGKIAITNYSNMTIRPTITGTLPLSIQLQVDEFNILCNIITNTPANTIRIKGSTVHVQTKFSQTHNGFMFVGSATCNMTKVNVTSENGVNNWSVTNPTQHDIRQCILQLNKKLAHELTVNRLPIINDVLCSELTHSSSPNRAYNMIVNPVNLNANATRKSTHTISLKIHADSVTPVYSYLTIHTPIYKLDRKKYTIMLEVKRRCNDTSILTDDHSMTVSEINKELKQLAKSNQLSNDELSSKFKYLLTATKPNTVLTEHIEAIRLDSRIQTTVAADLLDHLLNHCIQLKESTYSAMLNYSLKSMTTPSENFVDNLVTSGLTEKHTSMFNNCCSKTFPQRTNFVSAGINFSEDDPFIEPEVKDANFMILINQLKPETLASLSAITPGIQTELKFLQEWEFVLDRKMDFEDLPDNIETNELTQHKLVNIASMHLPNRTIDLNYVVEAIVLWPVITIINNLMSENHQFPMYVKLANVQVALQEMTTFSSDWTILPLICCTAIMNSYSVDDLKTEGIKLMENTESGAKKIDFQRTKSMIFYRDADNYCKFTLSNASDTFNYYDCIKSQLHKLQKEIEPKGKETMIEDGWVDFDN